MRVPVFEVPACRKVSLVIDTVIDEALLLISTIVAPIGKATEAFAGIV